MAYFHVDGHISPNLSGKFKSDWKDCTTVQTSWYIWSQTSLCTPQQSTLVHHLSCCGSRFSGSPWSPSQNIRPDVKDTLSRAFNLHQLCSDFFIDWMIRRIECQLRICTYRRRTKMELAMPRIEFVPPRKFCATRNGFLVRLNRTVNLPSGRGTTEPFRSS